MICLGFRNYGGPNVGQDQFLRKEDSFRSTRSLQCNWSTLGGLRAFSCDLYGSKDDTK